MSSEAYIPPYPSDGTVLRYVEVLQILLAFLYMHLGNITASPSGEECTAQSLLSSCVIVYKLV